MATTPQSIAQPTRISARFGNALDDFTRMWDLLVAVTVRDMRVRYQGTLLSFVWWIARPLAMGLVLYFALGRVLRLDIPNYSVFLLSALFPWFWFSGAVQGATNIFVVNGGMMKKVQFPRIILPLSAILFNTFQFLITLPILIGFVLVAGIRPDIVWLAGVPALIALQLLLIIGLGLLLATLNVFMRDLGPAVDVGMYLLFYLSAIIFPLDFVPSEFDPLMAMNPVAPLMDAWRNVLIYGEFIDGAIWPTLVITAISLALGWVSFSRLQRYFADAI